MTTRTVDAAARRTILRVLCLALALSGTWAVIRPAAISAADDDRASADAQDDLASKSELLQSPRWRRAIFELGEWLSTQTIYSPREVQRIKAGFNDKVMRMSSRELEYLTLNFASRSSRRSSR